MRRAELNLHPFNPRQISKHSRNKLRDSIKRVGLLQPAVIWNETTGHVVGGHRRLEIMDAIHENDQYELTVCVVRLDEKTENEQLVFLNNQAAMGDFDAALLKGLAETGLDLEVAGFDAMDVEYLFDDPAISNMFSPPPEAKALIEQTVAETEEARKERHDGTKRRRKEFAEKADRENDNDNYLVVVFPSRQECTRFLHDCKLPTDNKYVDYALIRAQCGLEP